MTDLAPNLPLLRKAVEWAEAEAAKPDQAQCEWYQGTFIVAAEQVGRECGTCYCIAGYVVALTDGKPRRPVSQRAADLLGIDNNEANMQCGLFWCDNTIEDVRRAAEVIAAEAGERL